MSLLLNYPPEFTTNMKKAVIDEVQGLYMVKLFDLPHVILTTSVKNSKSEFSSHGWHTMHRNYPEIVQKEFAESLSRKKRMKLTVSLTF